MENISQKMKESILNNIKVLNDEDNRNNENSDNENLTEVKVENKKNILKNEDVLNIKIINDSDELNRNNNEIFFENNNKNKEKIFTASENLLKKEIKNNLKLLDKNENKNEETDNNTNEILKVSENKVFNTSNLKNKIQEEPSYSKKKDNKNNEITLVFNTMIYECERLFKNDEKFKIFVKKEIEDAVYIFNKNEKEIIDEYEHILKKVMEKKEDIFKFIIMSKYRDIREIIYEFKNQSFKVRMVNYSYILNLIYEEIYLYEDRSEILKEFFKNFFDFTENYIIILNSLKKTVKNSSEKIKKIKKRKKRFFFF